MDISPSPTHAPLCRAACVLMAIVLASPAAAQDGETEAVLLRHYFSGNGLLNRGMYDLAATEYRQFLAGHADHDRAPVARYGLAVCLYRLGRHQQSVTELNQLRGLPDFEYAAEGLMVLGQCHLALGRPDQAAACFGDVLRNHTRHDLADDAAALEAEALYKARQYEAVEAPARLLAEQWPGSPLRERAELVWGLSEMALGRHADAARRFEEMSQRSPESKYADQVLLLEAKSLHRSDAHREAEGHYRLVIERGRDEYVPEAMYGLAHLLYRQSHIENAGRLIDRFLRRYPEDGLVPAARLLRGRVYFDQKDYERALDLFSAISTVAGDHRDDALYWMAKCALRQGDAAGAARRLAEGVRRFPDSELAPQMTYDRAVALVRAEKPERALVVLVEFRRAFPEHPLDADALNLMAAVRHQQRLYEVSLVLCRDFNRRYPGHALSPTIAFLAAENLFLMRKYEQSAHAYGELLVVYPDHEQAQQARFRLGMAHYHLQNYEEAEKLLASAAKGRRTKPAFRMSLLALGDGHFQRGAWAEAESYLTDYLALGADQPLAGDALLKLGLARQRQGDLEGGLVAYEELIERLPESPHRLQAIFESGQALVSLDRLEEADASFAELLAEGPESRFAPHALNHRGALAVRRRDYRQAAAFFGRASEEFPGVLGPEATAEALFQQGQALMSDQAFGDAGVVLERLINVYPSDRRIGQASALAAIAGARQDGDAEALARINRVQDAYGADLDTTLRASLFYEKAWCHRGLEQADAAAEAYRALLNEPGDDGLHHRAMLELAELGVEAERYEEAAGELRRLRSVLAGLDDVPADLGEHCTYQLGLCEYHLENHEEAAALLEEFLVKNPDSDLVASASMLCGEALFKLGRHKRAAGHLRRVVERFGSDQAYGASLLRLGECMALMQQWQESEQIFGDYLGRVPDSPQWFQAQFGIGFARENQGRFEPAIDAYREVVNRHEGPTAARAQFQIGECLFALKRLEEAVRELLRVDILYAYPQWSAAALYEAGRCFQEMGDLVRARKLFEDLAVGHAESKWATLATERLQKLQATGLPGQ